MEQVAVPSKQATASEEISSALQQRIDAMYARDRAIAIGFVVALWATIFFVLLEVHSYIANPAVETVCWIAAFMLVLFNTTSITAMVRHYLHDKNHIYSVDIKHLDAGR
ncbi:MAG TPA: hypothetical protein VKV77_04880 [Methylovirgula sp.]|nr:hypothetical protein [Methylovirgula sp.]